MQRFSLFFAVVALLFCSCGHKNVEETAPSDMEKLLSCVPTDAVSFIFCSEAKKGIKSFFKDTSRMDSFARLDLKEYNRSSVVISFHFSREIEELIALELKEFDTDSVPSVNALRRRAGELGLQSRIVHIDSLPAPVLLMSEDETLINSSLRHLSTGNSVKDVPGLNDIVKCLESEKTFLLIKNSESAGMWNTLGVDFGLCSGRDAVAFMKTYCQWMAFIPSWGSFEVKTFASEDPIYFCNVLEGDNVGETRLEEILPDTCTNVVALQFGEVKDYIARYEKYLDAHTGLDKYRLASKEAKQWLSMAGIREVAVGQLGDSKVLLLRASGKKTIPSTEKAPEYVRILFGKIFSMNEEVRPRIAGDWLIYGDAAAEDSLFCFEQRSTLLNTYRSKAVVWLDGWKFRVMDDKKLKYGN